ncbi:hypothetical protein Tco_0832125 [Tanacetum coccineum]
MERPQEKEETKNKHAKSNMAPLPPRDQRHLWLRYQVEGYTEEIVHDFEQRLKTIFGRHDLAKRMRMVYTVDDGQELGGARRSMTWRQFILVLGLHTAEEMAEDEFGAYWLGSERLIPDKGDLRGGMHLKRHIDGRKSDARLSGGYFIGRLAHHFGLVSDDGLRGLSVVARELPLIDMGELVKLNICMDIGDDWAWVAPGPEREQVATAGTPRAAEDAPAVDEGRLGRLEEEVQGLRQDVRTLRGLVERSMTGHRRFSTWKISCMTQLMEASGQTFQAFDGTFRGSSPAAFQRRTRQRTGEASTSTAPQHPDP